VGIVQLTSRRRGLPHHVTVTAGEGALDVESYLMPEHLRYADRRRLMTRWEDR
jgi:mRNA-degrading endonuclease toxin of MazEF toxin-antitoxin module